MNTASLIPQAISPQPSGASDFLDQCAAMSKALLTRLETLLQSPSAQTDAGAFAAEYQSLDNASRILKRVQDTFLSTRRALSAGEAEPLRKAAAAPKTIPAAPVTEVPAPKPQPIPTAPLDAPIPLPPSHGTPPASPHPSAARKSLLPNAPRPTPSFSPVAFSHSTLDPMEKALVSIAALEARTANCSTVESPFVAQLVQRATPPTPPLFSAGRSNSSDSVCSTTAHTAAASKKNSQHKPKKKR